MATIQGQDIICCQLCPNPVEHHCNLCHVDLCPSCIPKHMADKTKEHEVVGYTSRKRDTVALPTCSTHMKKQCETYCQDCKIPICITCLIDLHKGHEVTEINNFLLKQIQQIKSDIQELENTIVSKYRDVNSTTTTAEFDKVLHAIEEQENKICRAVHEMSIHLKDNVTKRKEEAVSKCKESESLRKIAKKEIDHIIQHNKDILRRKDATSIIKYQSSSNLNFQGTKLPRVPELLPGSIRHDQIADMFGYLHTEDALFSTKRFGSTPTVSGVGYTYTQPTARFSKEGFGRTPTGSGVGYTNTSQTPLISKEGFGSTPTRSDVGYTYTPPTALISKERFGSTPTGSGVGYTNTSQTPLISKEGFGSSPTDSGVRYTYTQQTPLISKEGFGSTPTGSGVRYTDTPKTPLNSKEGFSRPPTGSGVGYRSTPPSDLISKGFGSTPTISGLGYKYTPHTARFSKEGFGSTPTTSGVGYTYTPPTALISKEGFGKPQEGSSVEYTSTPATSGRQPSHGYPSIPPKSLQNAHNTNRSKAPVMRGADEISLLRGYRAHVT